MVVIQFKASRTIAVKRAQVVQANVRASRFALGALVDICNIHTTQEIFTERILIKSPFPTTRLASVKLQRARQRNPISGDAHCSHSPANFSPEITPILSINCCNSRPSRARSLAPRLYFWRDTGVHVFLAYTTQGIYDRVGQGECRVIRFHQFNGAKLVLTTKILFSCAKMSSVYQKYIVVYVFILWRTSIIDWSGYYVFS